MVNTDPIKICSTLKCRRTKLRMALGHIFYKSKTPISVADIQQALESQKIKVNKTSIYRELEFLIKNNILNKIQIDNKFTSYEYNSSNQKSYLICDQCGHIIPVDFNNQTINFELQKISQQHNFNINRHSLIFFGHCHQCQ